MSWMCIGWYPVVADRLLYDQISMVAERAQRTENEKKNT